MLEEGTKRFDLYDFFSVFLPGFVFIIVLLPFAPENMPINSLGIIISLAVIGFITGRIIHSLASSLEKWFRGSTHRDHFKYELKNTDTVSEELVKEFWNEMHHFVTERHNEEADDEVAINIDPYGKLSPTIAKTEEKTDSAYNSAYIVARSLIHMDGRGRSRTFQAVYAFHRSMLVVSFILIIIYFTFFYFLWIDTVIPIGYTPYIEEEVITEELIHGTAFSWMISIAIAILTGIMYLFRTARKAYRQYFAQYLISDFVVLSKGSRK